jgi:hypothetical protein
VKREKAAVAQVALARNQQLVEANEGVDSGDSDSDAADKEDVELALGLDADATRTDANDPWPVVPVLLTIGIFVSVLYPRRLQCVQGTLVRVSAIAKVLSPFIATQIRTAPSQCHPEPLIPLLQLLRWRWANATSRAYWRQKISLTNAYIYSIPRGPWRSLPLMATRVNLQ